jgi:hypothetical protein
MARAHSSLDNHACERRMAHRHLRRPYARVGSASKGRRARSMIRVRRPFCLVRASRTHLWSARHRRRAAAHVARRHSRRTRSYAFCYLVAHTGGVSEIKRAFGGQRRGQV